MTQDNELWAFFHFSEDRQLVAGFGLKHWLVFQTQKNIYLRAEVDKILIKQRKQIFS